MYKSIRPILFTLNPDYIHERIIAMGKYLSDSWLKKQIAAIYNFEDKRLHTKVFGIDFKNPVGLAAGFDKNGELLDFLPSLGFGFVEIGSVTLQSGEGNPKPRIFRLPKDKALINNSGLPNIGADKVYDELKSRKFKIPIGVNIAKTHNPNILGEAAILDICYSFIRLYGLGNYITLNISCPNTAEGKTFEDKHALNDLLSALKEIEVDFPDKKPILLKISPDLSFESIDDILEVAENYDIDGYVICNTSLQRISLKTSSKRIAEIGGGLSGKPVKKRSTELIAYVHKHLPKREIIGVGGISSALDAYEKIIAGASLVQVLTGLIYEGPGLVKKINKGLLNYFT